MIDPCPEPLPAFAQGELALQYRDGARAERDNAVLAGLRTVLVARHHARLRDCNSSSLEIAVGQQERDLLGRAQSREEPKLVVVALRLAPIVSNRGDERFGIVD